MDVEIDIIIRKKQKCQPQVSVESSILDLWYTSNKNRLIFSMPYCAMSENISSYLPNTFYTIVAKDTFEGFENSIKCWVGTHSELGRTPNQCKNTGVLDIRNIIVQFPAIVNDG